MTGNLALLERDVTILQLIGKFGFCLERHVFQLFNLTEKYGAKVIKRLVNANYIVRQRFLASESAYLFLTKEAAQFLDVRHNAKAVLNVLKHDTLLIDLYLYFRRHYNATIPIKTDKEIRREIGIFDNSEILRVPDLLIVTDAGQLAIELEISEKPMIRLEWIINSYIVNDEIAMVHYYLKSEKLAKKIHGLTSANNKFKFFILDSNAYEVEFNINYSELCLNNDENVSLSAHRNKKSFGGYTFS